MTERERASASGGSQRPPQRPPEAPTTTPLGLHLTRASRQVQRAFDDALATAGGSLPVWLVLLNVKIRGRAKQREIAAALELTEATVTHHLTVLERQGLLTRERDPNNRRVQLVELTPEGERRFLALRDAALAFDARLRQPFTEAEQALLVKLLDRLATTVEAGR
ncbi:MAG: MarR family transcriptional regulator [Conexibacteraceae bacterium]|nr:MarR family transcriptional regulator [Conexibacteraceae bacterium]